MISDKSCILPCALVGVIASSLLPATTTAWWRLEEGSAGADVTAAVDSSGNGFNQTARSGDPNYSSNVPGAFIFDPVSGSVVANTLSLDATLSNARVQTVNNAAFNTSFTAEMFIQFTGEPLGYNNFLRRQGSATNRWQIDFDHAANNNFGRGRARLDTPDGDNTNFVVGPVGGASIPGDQRLWIDTPAGDGDPASYTEGTDWFAQGDGANDLPAWHHLGISLDTVSGVWSFYMDYQLVQSRTLVDNDASGYVHPDALIEFGKGGPEYGTFIDEVRYSDGILDPSDFLRATSVPEPGTAVLGFVGLLGLLRRRR